MVRAMLLMLFFVALFASPSAANEPLSPDRGSVSMSVECPSANVTVIWRWTYNVPTVWSPEPGPSLDSVDVLWNGVSTLNGNEGAELTRQLRAAMGARGFLQAIRATCHDERRRSAISFLVAESYFGSRIVEVVTARLSLEGEVLLPLTVHRPRVGQVPVDEAFAPAAPQP
jgi:hypothetical protein